MKDTNRQNNDPFENFEGYEVPRYTQVPDQLLDEHLPYLKHAELKVLLCIIRRTFGWGRDAEAISLSQLERATGLSRRAVREAIKSLEEKHLIIADRSQSPRGDPASNVYRLNIKASSGKKLPGGRGESTLRWGRKYPTVGEKLPHQDLETPFLETALSLQRAQALAETFFQSIGQTRVAKRKRERALKIISELLQEGFSEEELRAAIGLAAERGARDAGLLPYLIGEAVAQASSAASQTEPKELPSMLIEPRTREEPVRSVEDDYEEALAELRKLPETEKSALREQALRILSGKTANEHVILGIMLGLLKRRK